MQFQGLCTRRSERRKQTEGEVETSCRRRACIDVARGGRLQNASIPASTTFVRFSLTTGWRSWHLSASALSRSLLLNYPSRLCSNADNPFAGRYTLFIRHYHRIPPTSIAYVCRIASFASVNPLTRSSTALCSQNQQHTPRWKPRVTPKRCYGSKITSSWMSTS
jgi:hypothetical protein